MNPKIAEWAAETQKKTDVARASGNKADLIALEKELHSDACCGMCCAKNCTMIACLLCLPVSAAAAAHNAGRHITLHVTHFKSFERLPIFD